MPEKDLAYAHRCIDRAHTLGIIGKVKAHTLKTYRTYDKVDEAIKSRLVNYALKKDLTNEMIVAVRDTIYREHI